MWCACCKAFATSEPTFARDDELTTVEQFSHQIDSEKLPHAEQVPEMADVIAARNRKDGTDEA